MSIPTLTLAIPTYNRRPKLERLLNQISEQTKSLSNFPRLRVLISNNCSTDGTRAFLDAFKVQSFDLRIIHQPVNIGGCRNYERLHRESVTDYTWIFSDDDLLLPGALAKVWEALDCERPDVLRFSFTQPLGNQNRIFNYSNAIYSTTDTAEISQLLTTFTKITSYVHRTIYVPPMDPIFHSAYAYGWVWLSWSFAVLAQSSKPKMVVISEPLAGCDSEETNSGIRFSFVVWSQFPNVYKHPFVQKHAPELLIEIERWVYAGWVYDYYNMRQGLTPASYFDGFAFNGRPPFRLRPLIEEPMLFRKWIASRLNIASGYKLADSYLVRAIVKMLLWPIRRTLKALGKTYCFLDIVSSSHPKSSI